MLSFHANEDFLKNDIRVKPDLDALGALGDLGWYCIRAILWAVNYELPKSVTALHDPLKNHAGVLLACGAALHWEGGKVATFTCSFLASATMDVTVVGTNGTLHLTDFVIPYEENSAAFSVATKPAIAERGVGWGPQPYQHVISMDLRQEALMVQEFARLVRKIRHTDADPERMWPAITRKTQVVLDAVKKSIDRGCEPVDITG